MKSLLFATTLTFLAAGPALSQTLDDLRNDGSGKNPDNVLTYGMGYNQNRYSPLKQVDRQTVKRLVPVWNVSLTSNYGEQAQPLVYDGVMYVTDAEYTVAIDIATGKQIWRTPVDWDPATPRVVCCGVSNKGTRDLQRQGLPRHARCAPGRARHQDRQRGLESEGSRVERRILDHRGADGRERRADHRDVRRGVWRARLPRRL